MKKLLLLLLCVSLLLGAVGCGKTPAATNPDDQLDSSLSDASSGNKYVVDDAINRFIVAFNQQTRYTLAGLTQKGDLSCTATIDLCQLTITSTKYGLHFSLTGGDEEAQRDRMLDVFWSLAQVADDSCSDQQAKKAVDYLKAATETITSHKVSQYVTVNSYVPIIRTNGVTVPCRMDFTASNYIPEE